MASAKQVGGLLGKLSHGNSSGRIDIPRRRVGGFGRAYGSSVYQIGGGNYNPVLPPDAALARPPGQTIIKSLKRKHSMVSHQKAKKPRKDNKSRKTKKPSYKKKKSTSHKKAKKSKKKAGNVYYNERCERCERFKRYL